ncbi:sodium/hydrogen exchanger family protein [Acinetobacter sp. 478810]|nr:sodium/hydrogen exchanger family protein [Acinetobacter sp. 478810]
MSFLLQATIFLGASLILVPLGKRLGIATVLGYLFTGILLGPSVLNIAHDPEAIMELAEFGVILLMFLIGLELRPQRLWEMRDSIFVMGSLQVLISGAVLMLIVLLLFQQQLSVSFVIGFALALSYSFCITTSDRKAATQYDLWSAVFFHFTFPRYSGYSLTCHHSIIGRNRINPSWSGLFCGYHCNVYWSISV